MSSGNGEGAFERPRPASPDDGFHTPEKRAPDPCGSHPRDWGIERVCEFLRSSGSEDPELVRYLRGNWGAGRAGPESRFACAASLRREDCSHLSSRRRRPPLPCSLTEATLLLFPLERFPLPDPVRRGGYEADCRAGA
uniref:Uncharacterized protein n=1 Tax=Podarcis muralis TaxID=64176 RepID=A0A670JQD2_PODMU